LFLVLALALGILLGILIMLPGLIGRSWSLSKHKKRLAELEGQQFGEPEIEVPPPGKEV